MPIVNTSSKERVHVFLPRKMLADLRVMAEENTRSLSQQIFHLLRQQLAADKEGGE